MLISPFVKSQHTPMIEKCLKSREMDPALVNDLPSFGLIATDRGGSPIAFGFVRSMEGDYGVLDSYITNPEMSPETRDEALHRLTAKIIKIAKVSGFRQLFAFSVDEHTIMRAVSHGFQLGAHVFSALDLRS